MISEAQIIQVLVWLLVTVSAGFIALVVYIATSSMRKTDKLEAAVQDMLLKLVKIETKLGINDLEIRK